MDSIIRRKNKKRLLTYFIPFYEQTYNIFVKCTGTIKKGFAFAKPLLFYY
jgi:hypothetical protein